MPVKELILKAPIEASCLEFSRSFSIEKACYLNDDEIELNVKREFDNVEVKSLLISFEQSESLWEISGKKCSDIRLKGKNYGNYCDIVDEGGSLSYVFNVSEMEREEKVKLAVESASKLCVVEEASVRESC